MTGDLTWDELGDDDPPDYKPGAYLTYREVEAVERLRTMPDRLAALMRWLLEDGHVTPVAARQIQNVIDDSLVDVPGREPDRGRVTIVADYLRAADTDDHHALARGIVSALDSAAHARW